MGRTYTITTVKYDRVSNWPTLTKTPLIVEDGQWVVEAWESDFRTYQTVGATPKVVTLEWALAGERHLLVSEQPFGLIAYFYSDGEPVGGKHFKSARQVHKGGLGRYTEIPKLTFAREAKTDPAPWIKNSRDRRRSHFGWARLIDLQKAMGMPLSTILLDYWEFVNFKYDRTVWAPSVEPTIDMLVASSHEAIHMRPIFKPLRLTRNKVSRMLYIDRIDWSNYWVRKGWANTLLRLNALGYQPPRTFPVQLDYRLG